MMDVLPRELQLKIIKQFDIDTRLKCRVRPGKLRVPDEMVKLMLGVFALRRDQTLIEGAAFFKRILYSSDRRYVWYFVDNQASAVCNWRIMMMPRDPTWPAFVSSDNRCWNPE
jgi:hypothetical protein